MSDSQPMCIPVSRVVAFTIALGGLVLASEPVLAQRGSWYVGVDAGLSKLSPDTDGSDFTLDDDASMAAGVYAGMDIGQRLGVEMAWTQLGEAGLSDGEAIKYSALSLGGIAYVLGETDARRRQSGWSAYLRLGMNKISNKSDIPLAEEDNIAIWAGVGLQWPVGDSWGLRGELTSFDGDAQAALASIYWKPGASRSHDRNSRPTASNRVEPVSDARVDEQPQLPAEPVVEKPVVAPPAEPVRQAVPPTVITVEDALFASASSCAVPAAGEPLDAQGCALFSGVLQGVEFDGDTTRLMPAGEARLSRLAESLKRYPELLVEIRVHTQTFPTAGKAHELSRTRAVAIARYLLGQGVNVKRLKARAFGDTQPRAGNDTAGGRTLNNRVELRVL